MTAMAPCSRKTRATSTGSRTVFGAISLVVPDCRRHFRGVFQETTLPKLKMHQRPFLVVATAKNRIFHPLQYLYTRAPATLHLTCVNSQLLL